MYGKSCRIDKHMKFHKMLHILEWPLAEDIHEVRISFAFYLKVHISMNSSSFISPVWGEIILEDVAFISWCCRSYEAIPGNKGSFQRGEQRLSWLPAGEDYKCSQTLLKGSKFPLASKNLMYLSLHLPQLSECVHYWL